MPHLSLTDLVDIVSASGTPKLTKVRGVMNRDDYEPAFDYYKQFRDAVLATHRANEGKAALTKRLSNVANPKKVQNYDVLLKGYKSWWGHKTLKWSKPPKADYLQNGVSVRVNPELGLLVNGTPHVIKLYLKADKLSKLRVDLITHVMELVLRGSARKGAVMSVLDVRRSKLISPTVPIADLTAALNAELAYVRELASSL
ncbi:MAG: hypothetical protein GKS06_03010 [Acidobacteria bacterium]|nr:hypothetical protein [Acidobacteriota bacterium]